MIPIPGLTAVVVDASVAVPFLDRREPWPARWQAWAERGTMLLAPAHFRAEVANGLLRGTLLTPPEVPIRLELLITSGVDIADRGWDGVMEAIELATRHRLTVYDVLYLQLAIDIEAPLATLDRALAAAARDEGVEVID